MCYVVPFGFGISYTNWSYTVNKYPAIISLAPLATLLNETDAAGQLFPQVPAVEQLEATTGWRAATEFQVNISNTGSRDADDVVLAFLVPPRAGKDGMPLQSLFGFERVHVAAGGTVTVAFSPTLTDFAQAQVCYSTHVC